MYQIAMDGPNVNLKFFWLYCEKREGNEQPVLVDCYLWPSHLS